LEKRNEERLENVEKRRAEKEAQSQENESSDFFKEAFNKEKAALELMLNQCEDLAGDKTALVASFDEMSAKCQQMQRILADSTMFLVSYDVKSAQEVINSLQQRVNESREKYLPKKKFAFKVRKKQAEETSPSPEKKPSLGGDQSQPVRTSKGFQGNKHQTLIMSEQETLDQDIGLSDLENCTIKLMGPPLAVRMDKLRNCIIISGPVSTAIFIDDCQDCTFIVACQQLRVHHTHRSLFYLHVTSRAIIEDSSGVGFAPYDLQYELKEAHFKAAGLDLYENNWSIVNDFNWLRKDEHSPNWYIIAENER
ncbi:predicted protein, partial [Nematostella vectensis]